MVRWALTHLASCAIMRKFLITLLALAAITATAQVVDARGTYNYIPNAGDRVPDGASGPGIVYTQRTTGDIISVGMPVYKNQVTGQHCEGTPTQCTPTFVAVLVGYPFTVQYQHLQMQGFMARRPQIGEKAEVIIRSTFYAAQ
jgi:hypothetical protein